LRSVRLGCYLRRYNRREFCLQSDEWGEL
jgi:hypothetical protein